MTISYNWLSEYLPVTIEPEKLSMILTSVGMEVESMDKLEQIKGGLKGLLVGEVLSCEKHPEADKLSITKVDIGSEILQIVCGAPNVAAGQKVIVAPIGTTIHPLTGDPLLMKKAKIRGMESFGMICAEDEIGIGTSHEGILVLPADFNKGTAFKEYYKSDTDYIYEIGLTPNRMNAMSHIGVARDICAWFNVHENAGISVKNPSILNFSENYLETKIEVAIDNPEICTRYSGLTIEGLKVAPSPKWLADRLISIGLKPINNLVDVTNFILHETGQPLHAFDLTAINGKKIYVQQLPEKTKFISLDEKERILSQEDIMICDGNKNPLCMAGVFGGKDSGVTDQTTSIFLESANFNPTLIRKTLVRHGLRTDAAIRFEKGVDVSQTVNVLKRAADLIIEVAGGSVSSQIIDVYPSEKIKKTVILKWEYLAKLSGKQYEKDDVKTILTSLGFLINSTDDKAISVEVPFTNPDISIPADIVEEIMRIGGLDNIDIPESILIAPSIEKLAFENNLKEKLSAYFISNGFSEILTNSITNSAYFQEEQLSSGIKILNSLSVELDIMKPAMLQTALECIAYNHNRKNNRLFLFEFGKTYSQNEGAFKEEDHLMIYISSEASTSWKGNSNSHDLFYLKGLVENAAVLAGINKPSFNNYEETKEDGIIEILLRKKKLGSLGKISKALQNQFGIKQKVLFVDINWNEFVHHAKSKKIIFEEIPKYPSVNRELSIVLNKDTSYERVQKTTKNANIPRLIDTSLLNIFESEKLGADKKSMAISYTFLDKEKTLTESEIDSMMNRLMDLYEKDLSAQIRRG